MADISSDIELLFGVLGGSSPSGKSGELIQGQLAELINELNKKNLFNIKVGIDTSAEGKKSWDSQIQEKLDKIGQSGKFSVQIPNLKLSDGAVSDFKKQLGAIVNAAGISAGTDIKVSASGIGDIRSGLEQVGNSATNAAGKVSVLGSALAGAKSAGASTLRQFTDIVTQMQTLLTKNPQMRGVESFKLINKYLTEFRAVIELCSGDAKKFEEVLQAGGINGAESIEKAKMAIAGFKNELADVAANQPDTSAFKRATQAINEYYTLLSSVDRIRNNDIALTPGGYQSTSGNYANLANELNRAAGAFETFTSQAARSGMSENELASLTQLLEKRERDLALAIEERAAKQREAAALADAKSSGVSRAQIEEQRISIKKALDSLTNAASTEEEEKRVAELTAQYNAWKQKIDEVNAAKSIGTDEYLAALKDEGAAIRSNVENKKLEAETSRNKEKDEKREAVAIAAQNNLYKQITESLLRVKKAQDDWTAAKNGRSSRSYKELDGYISELKDLQAQYDSLSPEEARKRLAEINSEFKSSSETIKSVGEDTKTLGERMGGLAQKFSAWLSISQVIMLGVRSVRQMISATIELNDAMTQLQIVTRSTDAAYSSYMDSISKTATRVGSSITDLISSTTTYARLGYSLDESSALAEFTAMLQNVGDIDVADAQDALTAIVKAFGISVDDIESIMDKLVITGNNFPISVSQIAEGMNNASSALAAAGNTFDQSVALLTAANTTIQNAAKSSTGLRTIAARLRSTKTELDELGETMTDAEYGDLVAALTKYNVALTETNGEFRSTYDIISDIADIWGELSSMDQAALANAIAGVRQQSVFYSLVEQFQEASGAMDDMANSAGTLQSSYDTYMESTTAHINQFKAAFQALASTTVTPEFVNQFVDIGTGLLKIVNGVMELIDQIGGLNAVLVVTAGIMVSMNAGRISNWLSNLHKDGAKVIPLFGDMAAAFSLAKEQGLSFSQTLSFAFSELTAGASGLQLAIGGIGIALAVLPVVVSILDKIIVTADEANDKMEESFSEFEEAADKVKSLNDELETTRSRIHELESKNGRLTFVEQSELEKLRESVKLMEVQADLAEKERAREAKEAAGDTVTAYRKSFKSDITSDAVQGYMDYADSTGNNAALFADDSNIAAMLAGIEQMKRLRDELDKSSDYYAEDYEHFQEVIDDATDSIWAQASILQGYAEKLEAIPEDELLPDQAESLEEINAAIALIYQSLDPDKWKDIQFSNLPDDTKDKLTELASEGKMTAEQVETLAGKSDELTDALANTGMTAQDVANYFNNLSSAQESSGESVETYTAQLSNLSETLSGMKSAYSLMETAQEEMNTTGGLSVDTIAKLAESCDNYMDYLYVENGLIKLNTEAWKENVDAKIKSDMDAIQREIASLEQQNALLEQEKDDFKGREGNTGVHRKILEINNEIKSNNAIIEQNQSLYSKYESIYKSITNAAAGWVSTLEAFDGASSDLSQLASIQEELSNGYTITAAKAREFAEVYPEILNEATVSSNGQITLNEAVVNSFLEGKEAEIRGAAQAEAEKLKAKQALLQAELAVVEEQIAAAESGDEAKVESANESAQARMTLEQAVLSACEQAGIDETTANQLALSAMTGDWDTFQKLAIDAVNGLDRDSAIAFNSVMSNFAIASQNMVDNTNHVIGAFNQMGKALQNAMNGVDTELYSGVTSAGNVSGTGNEAVSGLLSKMFEDAKSGYADSEGGAYAGAVEEWKARLQAIVDSYAEAEPDLSGLYEQRDSLNKQIADIQNQIGLLDSLGNTSLDKFIADTKSSGSSGGSSGGSKDASDAADSIIDKVGTAEDSVNLLSKALGELQSSGKASIDTVQSLDKAMGSLAGFNKAITALTSGDATMEEAQAACNELASEMLSASGILEMVTEENAEMIAGMLESIGVVNAHDLVWRKLASTALKAKVAEAGLADAAWEDVEAYLASTNATQGEIDALQALRAEQYNAALAATDFSKANADATESLIRQAEAAGASAESIAALRKLQSYQTMGYSGAKANGFQGTEEAFNNFLNSLAKQARIDLSNIKVEAPDVNVNVEVQGEGGEQSSGSKLTGTAAEIEKAFTTTYKAYEASVNKFAEATENLRKSSEALNNATDALEMEDDPKAKLEKQLAVIEANKKVIEDNNELIKQGEADIDGILEKIDEVGVAYTYDKESHSLVFPNQADGQPVDKYLDGPVAPRLLNYVLRTGNVPETGFSALDANLNRVADAINRLKPLVDSFNELLGTDISYEEAIEELINDRGDSLRALAPEKNPNAFNANGSYKSDPESQAFRSEFLGLLRNMNAALEEGGGKTSYITLSSGEVGGISDQIPDETWEYIAELDKKWYDPDDPTHQAIMAGLNNAAINSGTSFAEAYKESSKNLVDEAVETNKQLQEYQDSSRDAQKKIHDGWKDILDIIASVTEESSKSLDEIWNVYDVLKQGAKEFSESGGRFISVDTFQEIMKLEPKYLDFLIDENGQWAINEERIRAVTAAKTEQLALDNAWAYVKRIELALQEDSIENLDEILYATQTVTDGTWDMVYANLAALNLTNDQYAAAKHHIDVMRDLAVGAVDGVMSSYEEPTSGISDLIEYVMEYLKYQVQKQVDALNDMKDAYGEIVDKQKELLDLKKKENDYNKAVSDKLKEIAKLQARIDALSLDDSREAQAERAKLMEDQAELQESLSDKQSDYAIDNQKDALDEMKDAYDKEKDEEIKSLEDSISSKQKLWEKAIDYIKSYWETDWNALKDELLQWNYDVGNDLEENLVTAWENATAAAQRYGDFVAAMDSMKNPSSAGGGGVTTGNSVANIGNHPSSGGGGGGPVNLIDEMEWRTQEWHKADDATKKVLADQNAAIAAVVRGIVGQDVVRKPDGVWYLADGRKLYDVFREVLGELPSGIMEHRIYHKGGVVGDKPTLKQNEVMAKLELGEEVLDKRKEKGLFRLFDFATTISDKFAELMNSAQTRRLLTNQMGFDDVKPGVPSGISDNQEINISFGDTYITGTNEETVEKHRAITRQQANELLDKLNIKR